MKTLPNFLIKVLQVLAGSYGTSFSLEELAKLVVTDTSSLVDSLAIEKENQARVLEALIVLSDQGYVFLNPNTDKSSITLKGQIQIESKVLSN